MAVVGTEQMGEGELDGGNLGAMGRHALGSVEDKNRLLIKDERFPMLAFRFRR